MKLIAFCSFLLLIVLSCRTAEKPDSNDVRSDEGAVGSSNEKTEETAIQSEIRLPEDDSRALYLKMIGVEITAGLAVPKDRLHSSSGTVECRGQGRNRNCDLRVRLQDSRLSSSQPMSAGTVATVKQFVDAVRKDLTEGKVQIVDVYCDYVGKKSPPYDVEDVGCTLRSPRAIGEVIFNGRSAQIISEGLRANQVFGLAKKEIAGTILCQWIETGGRNQCMVRPMVGDVLLEDVVTLSPSEGHIIGREIRSAFMDQFALNAAPNAAVDTGVSIPSEIMGRALCVVDSTEVESYGRREYSCRIQL